MVCADLIAELIASVGNRMMLVTLLSTYFVHLKAIPVCLGSKLSLVCIAVILGHISVQCGEQWQACMTTMYLVDFG